MSVDDENENFPKKNCFFERNLSNNNEIEEYWIGTPSTDILNLKYYFDCERMVKIIVKDQNGRKMKEEKKATQLMGRWIQGGDGEWG